MLRLRSGVIYFEHISHPAVLFLLLTLSRYIPAGYRHFDGLRNLFCIHWRTCSKVRDCKNQMINKQSEWQENR